MPTVNISAFGPKPFWLDASGSPDVGYKLFMYVAGSTSTKQNSYTNSTGAVANANPIILNSLGQTPNELWWDSSLIYKAVLAPSTDTDPPTNPVWTIDNLTGMNSGSTATVANEWILYSTSSPAFVSANSFTVTGNQTLTFHIGRRLQFMTTAGFVYGRITNSVFSSLTTVTLQMDGTQVLNSSLSAVYYSILTNNVLAIPERIASSTGTNSYTATVGISNLVIGDTYKIFITNANNGIVSPTLMLDGGATLSILLQNGNIPSFGALNGQHNFYYNGTSFIVLNPNFFSGSYSGVTGVSVNTTWTAANIVGQLLYVNGATTQTMPLVSTIPAGGAITVINQTGNLDITLASQGGNLFYGGLLSGSSSVKLNNGEGVTIVSSAGNYDCLFFSGGTGLLPQTWQNMTASRANGTNYTNSTGRIIYLSANGSAGATSSIQILIGGVVISSSSFSVGGSTGASSACIPIPNGAIYSTNGAVSWFELR